MGFNLGGEESWLTRQHQSGWMQSFQWYRGKPALFIYEPRRRVQSALVVLLEYAYLWANSNGHPDLNHAVPTAIEALKRMGIHPKRIAIHSLVDAVLDAIPDLIRMPPEPTSRQAPATSGDTAELRLVRDGETIMDRPIDLNGPATPRPAYPH